MSGVFSLCTEDFRLASESEFISAFQSNGDFVQLFPPELSSKLFTYLSDKDIYTCSQCSFLWRQVINNNSQWKLRCIRRGWCNNQRGSENAPFKWTLTDSHIGEDELIFRPTPLFNLPPVASLRMTSLCDWALYFRQCLHIEFNWKYGRYIIHKMKVPDIIMAAVYNTFACNGKLFAAGTTIGYILIWSVIGPPTFFKSIMAVRRRVEIEHIQMTDSHMAVLCETGLLQVYNVSEKTIDGKEPFEVLYQIRVDGSFINEYTYKFIIDKMSEEQGQDLDDTPEQSSDNILLWIRELFHERPMLDSDYTTSDIFFSLVHQKIILTGLYTEAFFILDLHTGDLLTRVSLPPNMQICFKSQVKNKTIYLSARRIPNQQIEEATFHLLVYDLIQVLSSNSYEAIAFQSHSMLEEIQSDDQDKRLAWVGQDSLIVGKDLTTKTTLFVRNGQSYIDNLTLYDELILYHQYNGFIIGMDWSGVSKYKIEMRLGIVRGIDCSKQFLVSGGDEKNLTIWNRETGQKFHQVHQHPCRIERIWMDQTKIITLGGEDPPVLVGYW